MYLEQVFNPDEVELYSNEIDRIRPIPGYEPDQNPDTPHGHYAWMDHTPDLDPGGFMDRRELLSYGPAIIDLIDKAPVFDYVVELMGPNILLCMSQVIVRAPNEKFPGYTQDGIDKPILQWSEHAPCGLRPRVRAARGRAHCSLTIPSWGYTHTDGGASLRQIRVSEGCPPIALKAMWLLSDVTEEDSGNLPIFPGSHLRQIPDAITPYSPGAVQLMGKAGNLYLFTHSLWHGPAKNLAGLPRKTLLYNWCQL